MSIAFYFPQRNFFFSQNNKAIGCVIIFLTDPYASVELAIWQTECRTRNTNTQTIYIRPLQIANENITNDACNSNQINFECEEGNSEKLLRY